MILAGLWFDREHPPISTYLKPLLDAVNMLYRNGKISLFTLKLHSCIVIMVNTGIMNYS